MHSETDTPTDSSAGAPTGSIRVHYWASARAAAGTPGDDLPATEALTLTDVRRRAVDLHPGTRLADVLAICSTLVGDQPVGTADPASVLIPPGSTVEFLPPFAGG
ncbi:MAG: MoaD/ThiS family protein [Nocardioides sp.]|nr:MoaD/ThiS family protein [Nocardioides sp.]